MFEILAFAMMAQAAPAAETPAAKEDDQELVCKSEKIVGTNIRERVCLTRAQWRQASEAGKETLRSRSRGAEPRPSYGG